LPFIPFLFFFTVIIYAYGYTDPEEDDGHFHPEELDLKTDSEIRELLSYEISEDLLDSTDYVDKLISMKKMMSFLLYLI
jgi:hypothetical protein